MGMSGPRIAIVSSRQLARPGASMEAAYWMPPEDGGHREGETATEWRKRKRLERRVAYAQKCIARLRWSMNDITCICLGSGLIFDYEGGEFLPCTTCAKGN